jgi:hypothetical protein
MQTPIKLASYEGFLVITQNGMICRMLESLVLIVLRRNKAHDPTVNSG